MSTEQPAALPPQTKDKAILGAVTSGAAALAGDLAQGLPWWQALVDALVTAAVVGGVVHRIPNRPKARHLP